MPDIVITMPDTATAAGGRFKAYVATPAGASTDLRPAPTVIVIQEIFGITPDLRAKCDTLAAQGFIAVCPDLFWRLEPGVVLEPRDANDLKRAYDLMGRFNVDQGIADLGAVMAHFRDHKDATGKVGCIGFCLGGKMAYLMACRTDIDAGVAYYGGGIDQLLGEAAKIDKPVMLHFGEADRHIDYKKIMAGLHGNAHVTAYSYPGADHAFTRVGGEHYDDAAATLANGRTLEFLHANLTAAA